ncbi:hypothetical protein L218DRAFT_952228 [Marasmius fiardii PR-910]|nr:hypothetical protein L218DRAFT_952228 [Marasmius fiardii PR-910]
MNTAFNSSGISSISSVHLKRTHTEANRGFSANLNSGNATTAPTQPSAPAPLELPPLPKISGECLLQVYTHKSLRRSEDVSPEEFEDSERLSVLGERVLSAAVTLLLFRRRPMKSREEIELSTKDILSSSQLDKWVTAYKLREKVRCTQESFKKLRTPEETRLLFYAFAGGLYVGSGLDVLCNWLGQLTELSNNDSGVNAHTKPADPSGPPPTYRPSTSPPQKRMKQEPLSPQSSFTATSGSTSGTFFASQPPDSPLRATSNFMAAYTHHYGGVTPVPAPITQSHPHYSPSQPHYQNYQQHPNGHQTFSTQTHLSPAMLQQNPGPAYNPLSPAQPHLAFLPLFNQMAAQRKVKVDYQAQFAGPSHAGKWTVQCIVNGIPKGMGTGGTKQVAKEEAARQAYYSMGWT